MTGPISRTSLSSRSRPDPDCSDGHGHDAAFQNRFGESASPRAAGTAERRLRDAAERPAGHRQVAHAPSHDPARHRRRGRQTPHSAPGMQPPQPQLHPFPHRGIRHGQLRAVPPRRRPWLPPAAGFHERTGPGEPTDRESINAGVDSVPAACRAKARPSHGSVATGYARRLSFRGYIRGTPARIRLQPGATAQYARARN